MSRFSSEYLKHLDVSSHKYIQTEVGQSPKMSSTHGQSRPLRSQSLTHFEANNSSSTSYQFESGSGRELLPASNINVVSSTENRHYEVYANRLLPLEVRTPSECSTTSGMQSFDQTPLSVSERINQFNSVGQSPPPFFTSSDSKSITSLSSPSNMVIHKGDHESQDTIPGAFKRNTCNDKEKSFPNGYTNSSKFSGKPTLGKQAFSSTSQQKLGGKHNNVTIKKDSMQTEFGTSNVRRLELSNSNLSDRSGLMTSRASNESEELSAPYSYDLPENAEIEIQPKIPVAELRQKLWCNNEILQVAIPPSMSYAHDRGKQYRMGESPKGLDVPIPRKLKVGSSQYPQAPSPKLSHFHSSPSPQHEFTAVAFSFRQKHDFKAESSLPSPLTSNAASERRTEVVLRKTSSESPRDSAAPDLFRRNQDNVPYTSESVNAYRFNRDFTKSITSPSSSRSLSKQEITKQSSGYKSEINDRLPGISKISQNSLSLKLAQRRHMIECADGSTPNSNASVNSNLRSHSQTTCQGLRSSDVSKPAIVEEDKGLVSQVVPSLGKSVPLEIETNQRLNGSTNCLEGKYPEFPISSERMSSMSQMKIKNTQRSQNDNMDCSVGSNETGETLMARLLAKLSTVCRDNPAEALAQIDSIIRAESTAPSVDVSHVTYSKTALKTNKKDYRNIVGEEEVVNSDVSDDETSMSSMTYSTNSVPVIGNSHIQTSLLSGKNRLRPNVLHSYNHNHSSAIEHDLSKSNEMMLDSQSQTLSPMSIQAKKISASLATPNQQKALLNSSPLTNAAAIALRWEESSHKNGDPKSCGVQSISTQIFESERSIISTDPASKDCLDLMQNEKPNIMSEIGTSTLDYLPPSSDTTTGVSNEGGDESRLQEPSNEEFFESNTLSELTECHKSLTPRRRHPWDHHHPRNKSQSKYSFLEPLRRSNVFHDARTVEIVPETSPITFHDTTKKNDDDFSFGSHCNIMDMISLNPSQDFSDSCQRSIIHNENEIAIDCKTSRAFNHPQKFVTIDHDNSRMDSSEFNNSSSNFSQGGEQHQVTSEIVFGRDEILIHERQSTGASKAPDLVSESSPCSSSGYDFTSQEPQKAEDKAMNTSPLNRMERTDYYVSEDSVKRNFSLGCENAELELANNIHVVEPTAELQQQKLSGGPLDTNISSALLSDDINYIEDSASSSLDIPVSPQGSVGPSRGTFNQPKSGNSRILERFSRMIKERSETQ